MSVETLWNHFGTVWLERTLQSQEVSYTLQVLEFFWTHGLQHQKYSVQCWLVCVGGTKPTNIRFCLRNTLNFVCPLNDDLFPLHFQEYALMYVLVLPAVEGRKDKVGEWFLSIYSWLCSCFYFNLLLSHLLYYFFKLDSAHSSRDSSWQLLMATVNYEYSLAWAMGILVEIQVSCLQFYGKVTKQKNMFSNFSPCMFEGWILACMPLEGDKGMFLISS